MTAIENRIEGCWVAKQAAKGSPAATAIKRVRKVGGDLNPAREDGSQNWSDAERFSSAEDFVNTLAGTVNPQMQAQAGVLAYMHYLVMGQETVLAVPGSVGLNDHEFTPNNAGSFWTTWWKRLGESVGPLRQKFNDVRPTSLRVEGSSAQKVVQAVFTGVCLDPAEVFTSDPVVTEDLDRALLYTEGEGRFEINGAVFRGHSSFAYTINDGVAPWYGDSARPHDVVYGAGAINLEGITLLVNEDGLAYYNETIYGTSAPAAGAKPRTDIPIIGSYAIDLQRGTVYSVVVTGGPTGGTFTLTVGGQTTAAIAYNATAAAVKAALEALPNVIVGDVEVTGGPLPGSQLVVTFLQTGIVMTANSGGLTGGASPTVTPTSRGASRQFKSEFAGVKWNADLAIPGNPDGGATELSLGASTRKVTGQPHIKTTIRCPDGAFT